MRHRSSIDTPAAPTASQDRRPSGPGRGPVPGDDIKEAGPSRRRTALRDYYNLPDSRESHSQEEERSEGLAGQAEAVSELDADGFDVDAYITKLLHTEGLDGILKAEARLLSGKALSICPPLSRSVACACLVSSDWVYR